MELTWFTLAILATSFWGLSDVFFKKGTKIEDPYSHMRIIIMIGIVMGLHSLIELYKIDWQYDPMTLITYLPVSFLYILSMTIDYYGYRYLQISVGSPIASTSGAIAGILSFKVLGKTMTSVQLFAVSLITIGLLVLAYLEKKQSDELDREENKKYRVGAKALIFPIMYAVIDGVGTFLDDVFLSNMLSPEEAIISFDLTFFIVGMIFLFYIVVIKKQKYSFKNEKYNVYGSICETAGQFFYVYALSGNSVVAAPLMAVDSIVAVLFGRIYLKEKLTKSQYATILVITTGVFILGFFE